MKLSIYSIFDRLDLEEGFLIAEDKVRFNLGGVRLYTDFISELKKDLIYVITAEQLQKIQPTEDATFICLGLMDRDQLKTDVSVIFFPKEGNIHKIHESVQQVFDDYNHWMEDINNSILDGASLQSTLDKSSRYLKNPIALFDNCQGLLMKSGDLNSNNLDSIWSYVLEKGYSFKETEENVLKRKTRENRYPFYYHSPDVYRNISRLIAPIYYKDTLFGVLAMTELNAPFSKAEYAHLCLTKEIMENALKVDNEYMVRSETPWYMHRLVVGKYIDPNIASYHMGLEGRKTKEKFFLWCFSMREHDEDSKNIIGFMNHLSNLYTSSITFYHEHMILICDYDLTHYEDPHFHKIVTDFLERTKIKASKSAIFNEIFELSLAFKQCQISDNFGRDYGHTINSFDKIFTDIVLSSIEKNIKLEVLVSSDIGLLDPSKINERELIQTLLAYIVNGKNLSATAQNLNIHRHTVVYRLNKIANSTGIVLENLKDDALFQLYLSCKILLRADTKGIGKIL